MEIRATITNNKLCVCVCIQCHRLGSQAADPEAGRVFTKECPRGQHLRKGPHGGRVGGGEAELCYRLGGSLGHALGALGLEQPFRVAPSRAAIPRHYTLQDYSVHGGYPTRGLGLGRGGAPVTISERADSDRLPADSTPRPWGHKSCMGGRFGGPSPWDLALHPAPYEMKLNNKMWSEKCTNRMAAHWHLRKCPREYTNNQ